MLTDNDLFAAVRRRVESHGVRVGLQRLDREKPGEFDGPSVTVNDAYDPVAGSYYLVHALGSIVAWALDPDGCRALFADLDRAKKHREQDPDRLERAIEAYRVFEVRSSEYAVWVLANIGHAAEIPSYTNFFRADIEAMTEFHRTGKAPDWQTFFAEWNRQVKQGERTVEPFKPRPVPPFKPVRMRTQEVMQESDTKD